MAFQIGETIFRSGFEVVITSSPYAMHGGEWQDGVNEEGKTVMVPTHESVDARVKKLQSDRQAMQDGFRRLREISKR